VSNPLRTSRCVFTVLTIPSAWQVNTELLTFDLEDVKKDVESGNQAKKNKALWEAYQIAAEGHDLAHFKQVLSSHEVAMQEDLEQREQKEQDKKEKSAKRKSKAAADSEDVDMEDAGNDATTPAAKKAKATKKRKKGDESDGENEKVRLTSFLPCSTTNSLTACKDSKDQAQADNEDAKGRIYGQTKEGAQVEEKVK
jgi:hypothetical protein